MSPIPAQHSVVVVSQNVVDEIKRIIMDSEITKEDDHSWPEPDRVGRQELEVKIGSEHIHFTVTIESLFPSYFDIFAD